MAPSPPQGRLYRQTLTLTHKNLLIAYKKPITTVIRALLVPIALTLILCFLKHLHPTFPDPSPSGFDTSSAPIFDLADAISATSSHRLVFVTNGILDPNLDLLINDVRKAPGMGSLDTRVVTHPEGLFDVCPQTLQGTSECFASVLFTSFNETNADYTIAITANVAYNSPASYRNQQSILSRYLLPLQWTINSRLGNLSDTLKPRERLYAGNWGRFTSKASLARQRVSSAFWLGLVKQFVAPVFVFVFVGISYHLSTQVASERRLAGLMAAQRVTSTPRILSTILSFMALYLPGLIICSILTTRILFTHTNDGIFLVLTVLCGISLITSSHLVASFFQRSLIAGMTCSILTVCLALVTLAATLTMSPNLSQIYVLAIVFPPAAWATLISDTATTEANLILSADSPNTTIIAQPSVLNQSLYFAFFCSQIVAYLAATFWVEHQLWNVKTSYETLDRSGDMAVSVRNLSKTYTLRRKWFWPFSRSKEPAPAVNHVDMGVQAGSITFLLGPNGSGKTTLLKCVTGMLAVDSGSRIQLRDDSVMFGICPQDNVFWDALTVKEHVSIWRKLRTAASSTTLDDDDGVIAECDLTEKAHAEARTLSGGQLRKLQLAIAFAGGSKMCFIDEASSGLEDPLSRRNIWDIIQKGRSRRTTVITTHFLDEADVLADHIIIMYGGSLVCQGSSTALKTQYGDGYKVTSVGSEAPDDVTWKFNTSAGATRKVLELEMSNKACDVVYPTLEQVFLRVTSDFNTTVADVSGDGVVGQGDSLVIANEKSGSEDDGCTNAPDLNLDKGRSIGIARQVWVLFRKRYALLRSNWMPYLINLAIPIVVAAALYKFLHNWVPLTTCDQQRQTFRSTSPLTGPPTGPPSLSSLNENAAVVVAPAGGFTGPVQDHLFLDSFSIFLRSLPVPGNGSTAAEMALRSVVKVSDLTDVENTIQRSEGSIGFGLYAPSSQDTIFFHDAAASAIQVGMVAFDYITNRMSNSSTTTGRAKQTSTALQFFKYIQTDHDYRNLPISMLLVLAFIAAVSIAVIYPTYERNYHVRALQYSNGVSPFALWFAYLLFDTQFIVIEGIVIWGLLFSGEVGGSIWYAPSYLLGVFILFGIASYLGTYLVSTYFRRGTFGVAVGIHLLLTLLYLGAYVMNQYLGPLNTRQDIYTSLQYGLGLICPGANLARALWLGMNTFDSLCGKFGDADVSNPFSYDRYGGVYANLIFQIIFLCTFLGIYEYSSADWLWRTLWRKQTPSRGHLCRVNSADLDMTAELRMTSSNTSILRLSHVSKLFGRDFAADNVTMDISQNETVALLGGNGAGKTTILNMIRGELKPDFGDIFLDGVSVLHQPRKAQVQMGVCPQDDAVDNLSVRRTLEFYAAVKGLKNVKANVDQILESLNITRFANTSAKALSGGTKRKLTVAIALLGNPRVLLLDEPSTGQDAGAKRVFWSALRHVSRNRATLLTTHSLEEAEALASKVAILSTRMLATGTLSSLQDSDGGLYKIRAVMSPDVDSSLSETAVYETFRSLGRDTINYWHSNGLVQFYLVYDRLALGRIMQAMERLAGNFGAWETIEYIGPKSATGTTSLAENSYPRVFLSYSVTGPSLEDVFMNVVRAAKDPER